MSAILDFLMNMLGFPASGYGLIVYYVVGSVLLLILLDCLLSFIFSSISSLTTRGR